MIVVVVGMHKSGTSLVSRLIHEAGISMGRFDTRYGYDDGNTYERGETRDVNIRLLRRAALPTFRGWRMVRSGSIDRAGQPRNLDSLAIVLPSKLRGAAEATDHEHAAEIVARLSESHEAWGFKDPRTVLLCDFWRPIIPGAVIIGVWRSFGQVFERYDYRWKHPSDPYRVARSWLVHNEALASLLRHQPDATLIRYETLMTDDGELQRLGEAIGQTVRQDAIDPELYRSRSTEVSRPNLVPPRLFDRIRAAERQLEAVHEAQRSNPAAGRRSNATGQ